MLLPYNPAAIYPTRNHYIGGTDAARILGGDWLSLWDEKTGNSEPMNLDHVFRVQLGKWTEEFHLSWLATEMGRPIVKVGRAHHPEHKFVQGNLDGWLSVEDTFIELKHTNGQATRNSVVDTYLPQIAHYCLAAERPFGYLSFIAGNDDPEVVKVEPSRDYLDTLLRLEIAFWGYVSEGMLPDEMVVPPTLKQTIAAEAVKARINNMRRVDMSGNNQWADHAETIKLNASAAERFEAAKTGIKKLVEADVIEASGHGIVIKRDTRGALRLAIKEAA